MHTQSGLVRMAWMAVVVAAFVSITAAADKHPTDRALKVGSTQENLSAAYLSEVEAHARYLQYAAIADAEGYHQIGSMFRAIARGEEIHGMRVAALAGRENLAVPAAAVETAITGSTRENLEAALHDQEYEYREMYPRFQKQALQGGDDEAARLFEHLMKAEETHRSWYEQVLQAMDSYTAAGATFFVCPDCGSVFRSAKDTCPACPATKEKFEKIG